MVIQRDLRVHATGLHPQVTLSPFDIQQYEYSGALLKIRQC